MVTYFLNKEVQMNESTDEREQAFVSAAEAEKLMRDGNLRQLPVLTGEKADGRHRHARRYRPRTKSDK